MHYSAALPVCTYCKAVSQYCTCRPLHEDGTWVRVRRGYFVGSDDLALVAHGEGDNYYVVTVPALDKHLYPEAALLHAFDRLERELGVEL